MRWWRLGFILAAAAGQLAYAVVVGRIEAEGGEVKRWGADGHPRTSALYAHIEAGDVLATGADGWAVLSMVDGASLTLKPNTRMRVDDYRFTPDEPSQSRAWMSLIYGSVRSVTGAIGHAYPDAYAMTTPEGACGVLGTDHEVMVVNEAGASGTSVGTYDHVYDGATYLRTPDGERVSIKAGSTGAVPHKGKPGTLLKVPTEFAASPVFYATHGIDQVLETLHPKSGLGYGYDEHHRPKWKADDKPAAAGEPKPDADDKPAGADKDDKAKADDAKDDKKGDDKDKKNDNKPKDDKSKNPPPEKKPPPRKHG
ncbi:MAG: FecR domain-containing protein [Burkholderiales bacterium]|nr:FecR domain-containing protein [Burkholderiales bacterium]